MVSINGLAPSAVSAREISISGEVQLTGEVPTWTYLILDQNNNIKQIFSNGNSEGSLIAAENNMNGAVVPVTPEVAAQYEKLKPDLKYHYGYIYEKKAAAPKPIVGGLELDGLTIDSNPKLLAIVDVKGSDVNNLVLARPI